MTKNTDDQNTKGYCVVPLTEAKNDWKKVVLTNRLLRTNWSVYRNTLPLDACPAGSFFIQLNTPNRLETDKVRAMSFLSVQAQGLGIAVSFRGEELPLDKLTRLVRPRAAVLYATGEKWSLMTLKVLETLEFDVNALEAEDVQQGALDHANILFIPGGAHTDKALALGSEGEAMVKKFLQDGGGVLGFCGGAALLAQIQGGWGLLSVERETGNISKTMHGPIWIKPEKTGHPLWYGYPVEGYPLAPWYGRALHPLSPEVEVLGRYDRPTHDFYIDHELTGSYFSEYLPEEMALLDKLYEGCADPSSLKGMVAIAEGKNGAGRIIVGYPHPETPGLEGGFLLLANAVFYVTQNPPANNSRWLPAADEFESYDRDSVLSLLGTLRETHFSSVMPIAKDLVKFGTSNLYWTPRPHIPWCYIGGGKYLFYVCERLEAYGDEILRHLDEILHLINTINNKLKDLSSGKKSQISKSVNDARERLENLYRLSGQAISKIIENYQTHINAALADWSVNFKRLLLYRQLLAMMKDKGADEKLTEDVTRRSQKLAVEYLGGWRWADTSDKYKSIFHILDNACYYLSNLEFELLDVNLQLNGLPALYAHPVSGLKSN